MLPSDLDILSPSSIIPLCIQMRASGSPRAASVCAASFSWCGNSRSDAAAVDVEVDAEELLGHRRALDVPAGPARAPRASPRRCPPPACWPSTARSRAGPPCDRRPRRPRPGPSGRRRGATARRTAGASGRGSRRRRRTRRRGRARSGPRSGRRSPAIVSVASGSTSGRPRPRPVGVGDVGARSSPRARSAESTPCARAAS